MRHAAAMLGLSWTCSRFCLTSPVGFCSRPLNAQAAAYAGPGWHMLRVFWAKSLSMLHLGFCHGLGREPCLAVNTLGQLLATAQHTKVACSFRSSRWSRELGRQTKLVVQFGCLTQISCPPLPCHRVYTTRGQDLGGIDTGGMQNYTAALSRDGRFAAAATFTSDVKARLGPTPPSPQLLPCLTLRRHAPGLQAAVGGPIPAVSTAARTRNLCMWQTCAGVVSVRAGGWPPPC